MQYLCGEWYHSVCQTLEAKSPNI